MVTIGGKRLGLEDFYEVLENKATVSLDKNALTKVNQCYDFLIDFIEDKVIYGINTGFGPMAQYKIDEHKRVELQYNLIRSHCSGMGASLDVLSVKAAMLAQLNTLMLGKSGVTPAIVLLIQELLNQEVYPVVFEHGGVGASGDLVQLAHLALVYIGEGEVWHKGVRKPTKEVFAELGIQPLSIKLREGLALMNGTSVMTGIGIQNALNAKNLLAWSVVAAAMLNELVASYDDYFSVPLNHAKKHKGQRLVAQLIQEVLRDSDQISSRQEDLYSGNVKEDLIKKKVQEYYSLRCVPQILGPIHDTLMEVINTLENEVNSVNDNPVIDMDLGNVYHGGNFHGDYVSLAMDKLRLVITKLSMLSERQLNFLVNDKLNDILPPFVNAGQLGFNFGVQGTQFTATSTTAENQMLANSMYVHSIPNNNDNQDIVSMGTNAASMTKRVIDNAYQVMAIELLTLVQAIDYLKIEDKMSTFTKGIYQELKNIAPPFVGDTPFYKRNQQMKQYIMNKQLPFFRKEEILNGNQTTNN